MEYSEDIINLQKLILQVENQFGELGDVDEEKAPEVGKIIAEGLEKILKPYHGKEASKIRNDIHAVILIHTKDLFGESCSVQDDDEEHGLENMEDVIGSINIHIYVEILRSGKMGQCLQQALGFLPFKDSVHLAKIIMRNVSKPCIEIDRFLLSGLHACIANLLWEEVHLELNILNLFKDVEAIVHNDILPRYADQSLIIAYYVKSLLTSVIQIYRNLVTRQPCNSSEVIQSIRDHEFDCGTREQHDLKEILAEEVDTRCIRVATLYIEVSLLIVSKLLENITLNMYLEWQEHLCESGETLQKELIQTFVALTQVMKESSIKVPEELVNVLGTFSSKDKPVVSPLQMVRQKKRVNVQDVLPKLFDHKNLLEDEHALEYLRACEGYLKDHHMHTLLKTWKEKLCSNERLKLMLLNGLSFLPVDVQCQLLVDLYDGSDTLQLPGFTSSLNAIFNQLSLKHPQKSLKQILWLVSQNPYVTLRHAVSQAINPAQAELLSYLLTTLQPLCLLPKEGGTLIHAAMEEVFSDQKSWSEEQGNGFVELVQSLVQSNTADYDLLLTSLAVPLLNGHERKLGLRLASCCRPDSAHLHPLFVLLLYFLAEDVRNQRVYLKHFTLLSLNAVADALKKTESDGTLEDVIMSLSHKVGLAAGVSALMGWSVPSKLDIVGFLDTMAFNHDCAELRIPPEITSYAFLPFFTQYLSGCTINEVVNVVTVLRDDVERACGDRVLATAAVVDHVIASLCLSEHPDYLRTIVHSILKLYLNMEDGLAAAGEKFTDVILLVDEQSIETVWLAFIQCMEDWLAHTQPSKELDVVPWLELLLCLPESEFKQTAAKKLYDYIVLKDDI